MLSASHGQLDFNLRIVLLKLRHQLIRITDRLVKERFQLYFSLLPYVVTQFCCKQRSTKQISKPLGRSGGHGNAAEIRITANGQVIRHHFIFQYMGSPVLITELRPEGDGLTKKLRDIA